jgi:hypothetical protein
LGFLNAAVDLQSTPFTQEHLDYARGYWQFLIEKAAPEWFDNPKGHLAVHWQSDTLPSAVYLIDLAKIFYSVIHSITDDSQAIFGSKLRQLLFSNGKQYEEQLTELLVGALLTRLAKPLTMEPASGTVAPSNTAFGTVDYSFEWTDGQPHFAESTVFHVQRILDWEAAIYDLKKRFELAMVHRSLNRALRIAAPLELTRKTLSAQDLKKTLRQIENNEQGYHTLSLGKNCLDLQWGPVPHFQTVAEGMASDPWNFTFTAGDHVEVAMVAATDVTLKWPSEAEHVVTTSLRNTLDGKRRQFQRKAPYLLFIRITNDYVPARGVIDILTRRIYNNVHYGWVSAIGLLEVSFAQDTGHRPKVIFLLNPNSSYPLPKPLVEALLH